MRYEGPEHLETIKEKQHALVAHLKGPSDYADVMAEIESGHVKSRSAVFMLRLIDIALADEAEAA